MPASLARCPSLTSLLRLLQFPSVGMFRGDAEGMVEALIKACERKPVASTACAELFGRELVPWTDDSAAQGAPLDQPLEAGNRRAQPGSKFPSGSHKHARPSARMPESPEHKKGHAKRSKVGSTPPRSISPRAAQQQQQGRRSSCEVSSSFACPALAASPKPENLPMPTTGLMSRAIVRGRSPSPVKDVGYQGSSFYACGFQVQQLVRPVAA